jgi:hypothetical protein
VLIKTGLAICQSSFDIMEKISIYASTGYCTAGQGGTYTHKSDIYCAGDIVVMI